MHFKFLALALVASASVAGFAASSAAFNVDAIVTVDPLHHGKPIKFLVENVPSLDIFEALPAFGGVSTTHGKNVDLGGTVFVHLCDNLCCEPAWGSLIRECDLAKIRVDVTLSISSGTGKPATITFSDIHPCCDQEIYANPCACGAVFAYKCGDIDWTSSSTPLTGLSANFDLAIGDNAAIAGAQALVATGPVTFSNVESLTALLPPSATSGGLAEVTQDWDLTDDMVQFLAYEANDPAATGPNYYPFTSQEETTGSTPTAVGNQDDVAELGLVLKLSPCAAKMNTFWAIQPPTL